MIRTQARVFASASWYLSSGVTVPGAAAHYLYEQSRATFNRSTKVYRAWLETRHGRGFSTSVMPSSGPSTRSVTFKLAQLGEGIAECELLSWHVKVVSCFLAHVSCQAQADPTLVDCGAFTVNVFHP